MAEMHHSGPNYDDKIQKNIFERVENVHADLAWNHPACLLRVPLRLTVVAILSVDDVARPVLALLAPCPALSASLLMLTFPSLQRSIQDPACSLKVQSNFAIDRRHNLAVDHEYN